MQTLIGAFEEQLRMRAVDDLKVVILRNMTDRDFVTSDDPAMTTNRWLPQRKGRRTFGTNSAGLVLILPIDPRLLSICYNLAVYTVSGPGGGGLVELRPTTAIQARSTATQRWTFVEG